MPHTTEKTKGFLSSSSRETLSQSILLGGTKKSLANDVKWLQRQWRLVGVVLGPALKITSKKHYYGKAIATNIREYENTKIKGTSPLKLNA